MDLTGDDVILIWYVVAPTVGVSCSLVTPAVAGRGDEVSGVGTEADVGWWGLAVVLDAAWAVVVVARRR